jgi:hypothetical protein
MVQSMVDGLEQLIRCPLINESTDNVLFNGKRSMSPALPDRNVNKIRIFGILFAKILILQIESPAMNEVALENPNFSPIICDG